MRPLFGWLTQILAWSVILGVGAVITVAVLVPRVAGATPYTILTGSMRPTMPAGTMVVVRPTSIEEIGVGDVVTYQLRSGEPTVVTHRVVGVGAGIGGAERSLRTQGDANEAVDPTPVRAMQVKGVRWYHVPYLGHLTSRIDGEQRQHVLSGAVTVLLLYAAYMLVSDIRDRSRSR